MIWTEIEGTFVTKITMDHAVALAAHLGGTPVFSEGKAAVRMPDGNWFDIMVTDYGLQAYAKDALGRDDVECTLEEALGDYYDAELGLRGSVLKLVEEFSRLRASVEAES